MPETLIDNVCEANAKLVSSPLRRYRQTKRIRLHQNKFYTFEPQFLIEA